MSETNNIPNPEPNINTEIDQAIALTQPTEASVPAEQLLDATAVDQNPVTQEVSVPVTPAEQVRPSKLKAALAAAAVAVGIGGGVAVAAEDNPAPVEQVEIQPHGETTAWDLAANVKDDNASQREVSNIISEQADKQGYPGVEPNETYQLPDNLVSEEAEQEYAPEEEPAPAGPDQTQLPDPNLTPNPNPDEEFKDVPTPEGHL